MVVLGGIRCLGSGTTSTEEANWPGEWQARRRPVTVIPDKLRHAQAVGGTILGFRDRGRHSGPGNLKHWHAHCQQQRHAHSDATTVMELNRTNAQNSDLLRPLL